MTKNRIHFPLKSEPSRGGPAPAERRYSLFILAPISAMLLLGCDDLLGDDETSVEPRFIYQCVDRDADYACIAPGAYDDGYARLGDALGSVALDSRFDLGYGRPYTDPEPYTDGYYEDYEDGYYEYYYGGGYSPQSDVYVVSSSNARVTTGSAFTAIVPGLTAMIAVNGSDEVVDYVYVSVEPVTDFQIFEDGEDPEQNLAELELTEGESVILRGALYSKEEHLRGTPSYECSIKPGPGGVVFAHVSVNCKSLGAIEITAESEGVSTIQIETSGVVKTLTVNVLPGVDSDDADAGLDTEADAGPGLDSDTSFGDAGMDGDTDTDVDADTDTDVDTDTDSDVDTDTDTDVDSYDAGADAGADVESATDSSDNVDTGADAGVGDAGASSEESKE